MPICEVCCPRGLLSEEEKSAVAQALSALLIEAEGLPDNPVSRSICLLSINEADNVYVGGEASREGKIVVKIYAFADAYSERQKADLYARVTRLFVDLHPRTKSLGGKNVWCVIVPVEPGNFGVGGVAVSLEMTRQIAASYSMQEKR